MCKVNAREFQHDCIHSLLTGYASLMQTAEGIRVLKN